MMHNFKSFRLNILLIFAISFTLFYGCKNDLEINAPYDSKPIVYALINQYDSVHDVKITRSFLGNENPANYAKIPDSSNYDNVSAIITELDPNGSRVYTYSLAARTVSTKNSGTFYSPNQTVYTFITPNRVSGQPSFLNTANEYELSATLDGDKKVTGRIALIKDEPAFFYQRDIIRRLALRNTPVGGVDRSKGNISFATSTQLTDGLIVEAELPVNCKIAELIMKFNYVNFYNNGGVISTDTNTLEYNLGQVTVSDPTKVNLHDFSITSNTFFDRIANNVEDLANVPNLTHRMPYTCDFEIIMANDDFYSYIQVTKPSSDLNQNKPQFTNVDGGFGIYASRVISSLSQQTKRVDGADRSGMLNVTTQAALAEGRFGFATATKGFCIFPEIAANTSFNYLSCN